MHVPCMLNGAPRRQTNLALLQQYGSNAWRIHNYLNEASAKNVEKALEDLKNLTTEVNRERKNFQVSSRGRSLSRHHTDTGTRI